MMRCPLVIVLVFIWACKAFASRRGLLGEYAIEDETVASPNFTMRMVFQNDPAYDKMGNLWEPPGAWPVTALSVDDASTFVFEPFGASPEQKFFKSAMAARRLSYVFNFTSFNFTGAETRVPKAAWLRLYFSLPQDKVTPEGKKMVFSAWVDMGNGNVRILKEYTPFYYDLLGANTNSSSRDIPRSNAYALEWYLPVGKTNTGNLTLVAEAGAVLCVNGIEILSQYERPSSELPDRVPMQTILRLNMGSKNESLGSQGPRNPYGDLLGRVWQATGGEAPVANVTDRVAEPAAPFFVPAVVTASTLALSGVPPIPPAPWSLRIPGDAGYAYLVRLYFTVRKGEGDASNLVVTLNEEDNEPNVNLDESTVGQLFIESYTVGPTVLAANPSSIKSSDDHLSGKGKSHDDDIYWDGSPAPGPALGSAPVSSVVDDPIRVDVNIRAMPVDIVSGAPSAGTGPQSLQNLHLEVCALEVFKVAVSDLSSFQTPLPAVNAVWREEPAFENNHGGFSIGLLVGVIVGSVVAGVVCAVIVGFLVYQWSQKWRRTQHIKTEIKRALTAPITFRFSELRKATNNFSLENELGSGGFGRVYKGTLPGGVVVAVKLLGREARTAEGAFLSEVAVVGSVRHLNLAALRGFCAEGDRRLLVYDYYPNGSVDAHLFRAEDEKAPVLPWDKRWLIACDTARALAYLHEECPDLIIHRDLKPGNILLAGDWRAAVSDFGLARLGKPADTHMTVTCMAGTRGYLPPETMDKQLTSKYDVFAYGVIMLELVSGRRAVDLSKPREEVALVEWAWSLMEPSAPRPMRLVDPLLARGAGLPVEQVETLVRLGLMCCYPDPGVRPPMSRVLQVLQGNVATPPLPPRPRLEHSGFFVPTGYSSSWTPEGQFAAPQGADGLKLLQSTGDASNTTNQSLSTPFDSDSNPNSWHDQ